MPLNFRIVFFSILIFLSLFEVGLRAQDIYLNYVYPPKTAVGLWEYDSVLGWRNRPNKEKTYTSKLDRFRIKAKINSKGLRDEEYPYKKKEGVKRILLLGDSVTIGLEVEKDVLIDTQLENLLKANGNYEVINAGVSAYGTDQSYLFLKNEGYKYAPDIIIYGAVNNDPAENITIHQHQRAFGKSYFIIDENNNLVLKGVPVPQFKAEDPWVLAFPEAEKYYNGQMEKETEAQESHSIMSSMKRDFSGLFFYQWLQSRIKRSSYLKDSLIKVGLKAEGPATVQKPDIVKDYEYRIMRRLVEAMSEFSKSINAKFLVYEFTNGVGIKPERPTDVEKICQGFEIKYLNLSDQFYEISKGKKVLCHHFDGHWNAKGHKLAAENIYKFMKQEMWI